MLKIICSVLNKSSKLQKKIKDPIKKKIQEKNSIFKKQTVRKLQLFIILDKCDQYPFHLVTVFKIIEDSAKAMVYYTKKKKSWFT